MIARRAPGRRVLSRGRLAVPRSLTACSLAGPGWLIAWGRRRAVCVDLAGYCEAAPHEVARIARMGRTLILTQDGCGGRLRPDEVSWVLAKPGRIACLVDFLVAPEDLSRVLTTPLRVTFTPQGWVRWRFMAAPENGPRHSGALDRIDLRVAEPAPMACLCRCENPCAGATSPGNGAETRRRRK